MTFSEKHKDHEIGYHTSVDPGTIAIGGIFIIITIFLVALIAVCDLSSLKKDFENLNGLYHLVLRAHSKRNSSRYEMVNLSKKNSEVKPEERENYGFVEDV